MMETHCLPKNGRCCSRSGQRLGGGRLVPQGTFQNTGPCDRAAPRLLRSSVLSGVGPAVKLPIPALRDDSNLPGVGIFSDIGIGVRRDDQDPHHVIGLVADLMSTTRPTWQGDNISFTELPVAVVQTRSRRSPKDNE